jgi:hypothetical protein
MRHDFLLRHTPISNISITAHFKTSTGRIAKSFMSGGDVLGILVAIDTSGELFDGVNTCFRTN